MAAKRHAPRSASSQSSDKEDMHWEEKRRRLNDNREVHSSVVAASSTQLLLVEVNKKFSEIARDYSSLKARVELKEQNDIALWSHLSLLEAKQTVSQKENEEHFAALAHQGLNVHKRQGSGTYIPILADLIIDTAASAHVLTELTAFHDLKSFNSTIRLADGSSIQVFLRGTMRVSARDVTGRLRFLDLANCLYVPSLSHSLFSIPFYLKAHRENTVTFLQEKIVFNLPGHVQIEIPANNFNKVNHAMAADTETTKNLSNNVNKSLFYFKPSTIPSVDLN